MEKCRSQFQRNLIKIWIEIWRSYSFERILHLTELWQETRR
jgi:hypothetical protein